ncbi:hypothetical protein [Paraburkholderia madseniana]|uniref:hypothetical protein n=1 Tax=Paraburkholderia madseniana TaxID=2599607 RepID=UPI0018EC5A7B|nr:hypothetical protein [Paraburkholderia madseniana]
MTSLHALSATTLRRLYKDREVSPVEVTQAVLEQMVAWKPIVNATFDLGCGDGS